MLAVLETLPQARNGPCPRTQKIGKVAAADGMPSRTRAGAAPLKWQSTKRRAARALLEWKRVANSFIGNMVPPGESRSVS
jgi:hypothetical protein